MIPLRIQEDAMLVVGLAVGVAGLITHQLLLIPPAVIVFLVILLKR